MACTRRLVVYTTDWAQWRASSNGRPKWCDKYALKPADIDPTLPTHINYAFAKINPSTYAVETVEFNDEEMIEDLIAHKADNPDLKILISIGGWSFSRGSEAFKGTGTERIFPAMAASASNRAVFVASAIEFATSRGFDGIDIDWE